MKVACFLSALETFLVDLQTRCVHVSSKTLHVCAYTRCTHSHTPAQISTWQPFISDRQYQTGYRAVVTCSHLAQRSRQLTRHSHSAGMRNEVIFFLSCGIVFLWEGFSPLGSCAQSVTSSMSSCLKTTIKCFVSCCWCSGFP